MFVLFCIAIGWGSAKNGLVIGKLPSFSPHGRYSEPSRGLDRSPKSNAHPQSRELGGARESRFVLTLITFSAKVPARLKMMIPMDGRVWDMVQNSASGPSNFKRCPTDYPTLLGDFQTGHPDRSHRRDPAQDILYQAAVPYRGSLFHPGSRPGWNNTRLAGSKKSIGGGLKNIVPLKTCCESCRVH